MSKSEIKIDTSYPLFLFTIFLVLKLTNLIAWSWWWVTAPLWIPPVIIAVVMLIMAIYYYFKRR